MDFGIFHINIMASNYSIFFYTGAKNIQDTEVEQFHSTTSEQAMKRKLDSQIEGSERVPLTNSILSVMF